MNKSASVFLAGVTTGLLAACIVGALVIRPKTSGGSDAGARGIVLKLAHGLDEAHPVHQAMTLMKQRLEEMNWTQPPYRDRYPQLADLAPYYEREDGVPPEGNVIRRNLSVEGPWLQIYWHAKPEMVTVENNLVDVDLKFVDREGEDFRLREDSPAWGIGWERIPLEEIGVRRR